MAKTRLNAKQLNTGTVATVSTANGTAKTKTRKPRELKRSEHVNTVNGVTMVTTTWFARVHGLERNDVSRACSSGNVPGSQKTVFGNVWILPETTKPETIGTGSGERVHTGYRFAVWVATDANGKPNAETVNAIRNVAGVNELFDVTERARLRRLAKNDGTETGTGTVPASGDDDDDDGATVNGESVTVANHGTGTFRDAVTITTDIHGNVPTAKHA